MASMRDIKQRISSVKNTQQITKAMNLVSASKLQKAKTRMENTRPFYDATKTTVAGILNFNNDVSHPYFEARDVKKSLAIAISADIGLCGGYNSNACNMGAKVVRESATPMSLITVGSKARDYFKRRKFDVIESFTHISDKPYFKGASKLGELVLSLYDSGEYDEVYIVYTHYHSTISHEPKAMRVLPVDTSLFSKSEEVELSDYSSITIEPMMSYEPNVEETLNAVIPQYVNTVIYGALLESATCEQGARMTAMDAATKNAGEMIDKLTISYNRARQAAITQEIAEIVGGANALQ